MSRENISNPLGLPPPDVSPSDFYFQDLSLEDFVLAFLAGAGRRNAHGATVHTPIPDAMGFQTLSGGTGLTRTDVTGDFAGYELTFHGSGFAVDSDGDPTAGTVTDLEIRKGSELLASFEFLSSFNIDSMLNAVDAGTDGRYSPTTHPELFQIFVPAFGFLIGDGSKGADTFSGSAGADEINGRGGNDVFMLFQGNDQLNGSSGSDMVDGSWLEGSAIFDLTKGRVTHDVFQIDLEAIERVIGSPFGDTIKGNGDANRLFGGDGNDTLIGRGGNDTFSFAPDDSADKVKDFQDGKDKFDLVHFEFESKAQALFAFVEIGAKDDNKLMFSFEGTTVLISGVDRFDMSGSDVII